ncbi:hypothetical protein KGA66_02855 [Actinocrinis puniceicyclus]|uniref:Uncharacterized protein n=1 Tax=Actinocrinis puniceicyclus TaxID=977794 RepID=A0A8J8B9L7_9ACTN|nr:hypothetical protein [Actinocrinis puniceicyclus]MBS2961972.1 hypothetical protein [Actinocrinis puniceicyclus]
MTIAGGLGLIILGAILRYAVTWRANWIDIDKLGAILIFGGAVGLAAGLAVQYTRRRGRTRKGI